MAVYRLACSVCDFTEFYDSVAAADEAGMEHLAQDHMYLIDEDEDGLAHDV